MARQTLQPDEWIVADGGVTPARCTMGQIHIHDSNPPGATNFANNLLNGTARATGDLIILMEDDDAYRSDHIELMASLADRFPLIGSDEKQHYYNVALRCFRTFNNVGASMCQTAIRRDLLPLFQGMIRNAMRRKQYSIDSTFWRSIARDQWGIVGQMTVLGIKGLPGTTGLGIGHRPLGPQWQRDADLSQLKAWIGEDAELYESFYKMTEAA